MNVDDILFSPIRSVSDIKIPECWLDVIGKIRSHTPKLGNATIAGGALRDLDLGRAIKDVDIFIPNVANLEDVLLNALDDVEYTSWNPIHHVSAKASAANIGVILDHYQFEVNGWRFEAIPIVNPFTQKTIIEQFDLGLCMITLDGDTVYRAPEYKHDVAHKLMTIVNQKGNGSELRHAKRLLKKYVGWTIRE
jgi:hypothetical protein